MKKIKQFFRILWFYISHKRCNTCNKWVKETYYVNKNMPWVYSPSISECEDCVNNKYGKGKWSKQ